MVNGPEDLLRTDLGVIDGDSIVWDGPEREVERLRQRIFKAAKEEDWPKVRNLQKLMLRSRSNTLVSVRQVTQRNAGRVTAGIDGEVALTSEARADVAARVHQSICSWQPRPVKRVYIPKSGNRAKLRPLGIPVIVDRCHQARVRNALEPEWEARFEPRSYGFRPGRSCQDAIRVIHTSCKGSHAKRVWALDADLAAAFDRINHDYLLGAIGGFPARGMIAAWLKAGVFEPGKGFAPSSEGTPQGGVISPLLMNVALHGLEEAAGVRYLTSGVRAGDLRPGSPTLIRYADDLVALCHSQGQAEQVKARLAAWLAPRGLVFNEDKTQIVHLSQGFDFLGFNIRRYSDRKLLYKWSTWSHHDKPKSWIVGRYFGKRNKFRNDHWVFGAPGTGAYVVKFAWTGIVRHVMVKGRASPDDPELAEYWAERRRKVKPPLDDHTLRLLARQNALCPLCGDPLLSAEQPPESPGQWERWWLQLARKAIAAHYLVHHGRPGSRPDDHTRLVHASCRRGHRPQCRSQHSSTQLAPAACLSRMPR